MQEELKPCPHCPKSMVDALESEYGGRYQVFCGACGSSSGSCKTKTDATALWNCRPFEARAKAEAEPQGEAAELVRNLAMLVYRLAHRLSLDRHGKAMAAQAMDFLIRHKLQGLPLRTPHVPPEASQSPEPFPALKDWEAAGWLQNKYPGTWELHVDPLAIYEAFLRAGGASHPRSARRGRSLSPGAFRHDLGVSSARCWRRGYAPYR